MGSFLVRWKNCVFWVGVPLWSIVFLFHACQLQLLMSCVVPFLIMGRVTYLHHYVRVTLPLYQRVSDLPLSLAPNPILRSPDARPRARPLHLLIQAPHYKSQKHLLWRVCFPVAFLVLVVQGRGVWY